MTVKDLIEMLKNVPDDAEVTLNYVYPVNMYETISCTEDAAEVVFDKYANTVDFLTKGYKEN